MPLFPALSALTVGARGPHVVVRPATGASDFKVNGEAAGKQLSAMPAADFRQVVPHVVICPSFSLCCPAAARCPDTLPPWLMVPASGWSWAARTSSAASTSSQKPRNSLNTDVPPPSPPPALKPMVDSELKVICAAVTVFAPPTFSVLAPETVVVSSPPIFRFLGAGYFIPGVARNLRRAVPAHILGEVAARGVRAGLARCDGRMRARGHVDVAERAEIRPQPAHKRQGCGLDLFDAAHAFLGVLPDGPRFRAEFVRGPSGPRTTRSRLATSIFASVARVQLPPASARW